VDPQPRWSLPPDGQGEPEDPAQDAQGPAPEEPPDRLKRRHRSRPAGAAHHQGRRGPAWIDFPDAAQVIRICRTQTTTKRKSTGRNSSGKRRTVGVVHLVCSLPMDQAQPEQVTAWVQGHWMYREPTPLDPKRCHGRGPPPVAHRQRPPDHGRPEEPGHPASSASPTAPTLPLPPPDPWARRPERAIRLLTQPTT